MNSLNTKNTSTSLGGIIEEINRDIYNGELTEIIEVTYSYSDFGDCNWNTTLFTEFGGCENTLDFGEIEKNVGAKLQHKIDAIDAYLLQLEQYKAGESNYNASELSDNADHIRHGLLVNSLIATKNTLNMALIGLPFELEKAGMELSIDESEIAQRVEQLEQLETQNFGGNVRDNPEEVIACYENIRGFYDTGKSQFTGEEQKKYEGYLSKVEDLLPTQYVYVYKEKGKEGNYFSTKMQAILKGKIARELYSQDFLTILNDFLGLNFEVRIEEGRGSVYDGPGYIAIPGMDKYQEESVARFLKLVTHELEAHSTNLRTTEKGLGNFRGAGSVTKEEALAMMSEKLLMGENLKDVGITQHFPKVLMGELLNAEELEDFLGLHTRLDPDPTTPKKRMLRVKRNYPLGYKGGQHKDTAYSRGVLQLKEFLGKGGDIRDYFLGKVSAEDLPKMKKILKLEGNEGSIHNPLMIAELLLYHLMPVPERPEEDFLKYLKKKYPFIDFKDEEVQITTLSQKKKVVDILWHLRHKFPERKTNTPEKIGIDNAKLSFLKKSL